MTTTTKGTAGQRKGKAFDTTTAARVAQLAQWVANYANKGSNGLGYREANLTAIRKHLAEATALVEKL